jgi:hypothetical protein
MRWIIEANIARLKALLKTELDPTKHAMEARLLAEEEAKLSKQLMPDESGLRREFSRSTCANGSA